MANGEFLAVIIMHHSPGHVQLMSTTMISRIRFVSTTLIIIITLMSL